MRENDQIGADGGDIARSVFGIVHGLGKGVLNAFGMGGVSEALEKVEMQAGLLPSAGPNIATTALETPEQIVNVPVSTPSSTPVPTRTVIANPDAVVLIRNLRSGRHASGVRGVRQVVVQDGVKFQGNGYKKRDPIGQTF